jgi:hypothetical protein
VCFHSAFGVLYGSWLLVVARSQFLLNLVAGAPARMALASSFRAWVRITPHEIHVEEARKGETLPDGSTESGFSTKPVTFTAAPASGLLFAVSALIQ